MSWESIVVITATILSIITTPVVYIYKSIMQRIETLEKETNDKMTESEVRILLDDKLEPMKDDLHEIKTRLDSILDRLIKKS